MFDKPIFEKPNAIVTGGAGFIGSHLCEALLEKRNVICVDNFISGSQRNIAHLLQRPDFIFLKHDITAPLDLAASPELSRFKVQFQGIQEIYHLACPTSPKDFEDLRVETLLANSYGTVNALHLAYAQQAKILLASSSVVYGNHTQTGFQSEDRTGVLDHLSPRACYDEGKRFAETAFSTYRQQYGMAAKIARIYRTYGPRQRLRIGEMLPDFIVNALEGRDLTIYGDASFTTSLTYVSDIVGALVQFMESDEVGPMNFGSTEVFRLADVAQRIIELTGSTSQVRYAERLLFMTEQSVPDIGLARNRLNWLPVTRLDDGLQKSIDYAQANKEHLGY